MNCGRAEALVKYLRVGERSGILKRFRIGFAALNKAAGFYLFGLDVLKDKLEPRSRIKIKCLKAMPQRHELLVQFMRSFEIVYGPL